MDQETFAAVDAFVEETLLEHDESLRAALDAAESAGLPQIQVSAPQGRLLQLLARLQGAKTILEFGTLGGYSTILLARALPWRRCRCSRRRAPVPSTSPSSTPTRSTPRTTSRGRSTTPVPAA
jgi:hypothetical protein